MAEGCDTLCRTCTKGHIITGFRATEEEVFCRTFYIAKSASRYASARSMRTSE